ncbi:hypothetical protein [Acaryochloris sp. CCMEE 5410]|uniref:hypothetical protein n=1 Tax=Acaryochloris sp. CCMEE 5410 TaxID=310037 RepID=UPI0021D113F4|nr:hypothetical protein [Acaryochloris sp. CCMEE 5410]
MPVPLFTKDPQPCFASKKLKRNTTTKSGSLVSALYSAKLYELWNTKICQAVRLKAQRKAQKRNRRRDQ